uniref:Uncharacterized protein n=1 Tax=Eubacterium plexicaudatum ASF492 TaxID=1235802 RepID=N2AEV5_9FIRM
MCVAVSDTIMRKKQAKIFFLYLAVFLLLMGDSFFRSIFQMMTMLFCFIRRK